MLGKFLHGLRFELKSIVHKPFKVGLLSYYYPSEKEKTLNGVGIHVYYLSRELANLGCEVHVFAKGEKEYVRTNYLGEGKLVTHWITTKTKSTITDPTIAKRMSYFLFDNKVINGITDENSKEPFNVIHSHGWLTSGAFISKFFCDLKWVHTFHSLEKNRLSFMSNEEKKYFNIARWIESTINHADLLISVSDNLKKETLEGYNIRKEKIFTVPNGVDLDLFKSETDQPKNKNVLYMGRFSLEKGIDYLPEIIERVFKKDKEIKFEILAPYIGVPASLEKIKTQLEYLIEEYPERIVWHKEKKGREEILEIINNSQICIQPSRYEAFGMTVLESMACGKVPIVSNNGGLPEVVGDTGIVVPLDPKEFSKAILKLLKDSNLRISLSHKAIERAQKFGWNTIAEKTLLLYKKISGKLRKGEDKYGITETIRFGNEPSNLTLKNPKGDIN